MKLFILETYQGDRWVPLSFAVGTYRQVLQACEAHYTDASRLRRVCNREEYTELRACMVTEMVSVGVEFDRVRRREFPSSTLENVEWV